MDRTALRKRCDALPETLKGCACTFTARDMIEVLDALDTAEHEIVRLEVQLARFQDAGIKDEERKCEGCGKLTPVEKMHMDSEGVWLCDECWQALLKEESRLCLNPDARAG